MIDIGELGPGEIGFLTGSIKEVADTRVGDTITDDRRRAAERAARLPAGAAGGLLRALPGRRRRLRGPARRDRQAPAQRRELLLRDGDLRRARLRLPLRLPRPPAPRDHPGAADARVRPRPDRHRALGHLPDHADRRHASSSCTTRPTCRTPVQDRRDPRAVDPRHHPHPRRVSRRDPEALPGPARHARSTSPMSAAAPWCNTTCRSTRWSSTSTTG